MAVNATLVESAFREAITSWGAVYAALFMPAVMMLGNFVFGQCFVSEAIGAAQHTDASLHTRYRIIGRGFVAVTTLLLTWEYYVYFFASRRTIKAGRPDVTAAQCNPLYVVWDLVDCLPFELARLRPRYAIDCAWNDLVFLSLFSGFAATYLMAVFSVPQVPAPDAAAPLTGTAPVASYCCKCAAHVEGMCHHCHLVGNCVGVRNRALYITCLVLGVGNLAFLLHWCGSWAFWQQAVTIHLGLMLVLMALTLLSLLLAFQLLLLARGVTTIEVLKIARRTSKGFWAVLLSPLPAAQPAGAKASPLKSRLTT